MRSDPATLGGLTDTGAMPTGFGVAPRRSGRISWRTLEWWGAGIALLLLRLQPARMQVARLHLQRDHPPGGFGVHLARVLQLAHVQPHRLCAAGAAGGRGQPAQVLEGVVRADHGIQVRAAREHRRIGLAQVRDVFRSSKFGNIAGCIVRDGTIRGLFAAKGLDYQPPPFS